MKGRFTGSTSAGKDIARTCGELLKPVTLELGGKSAAVVLEDADLDAFLPFVGGLCIPNSGQICFSTTRILAPMTRYRGVVDAVADTLNGLTVGYPRSPDTVVGPPLSGRQRERVEGYIQLGRDGGAKIAAGGRRHGHRIRTQDSSSSRLYFMTLTTPCMLHARRSPAW